MLTTPFSGVGFAIFHTEFHDQISSLSSSGNFV